MNEIKYRGAFASLGAVVRGARETANTGTSDAKTPPHILRTRRATK